MPLEAQLTNSEKIFDINLCIDEILSQRLAYWVRIVIFELFF